MYYGDNLDILRKYIKDESVDLIYLDPPFNSNTNYNVLFKNKDNSASPAQIRAFKDTWTWSSESELAYDQLMETKIGVIIKGLREIVGTNNLMAYLVMMAIRILELYRILKNTGSMYLHCDPTASHYLKIILDAIFDVKNFRNEIVWKKTNSPKAQSSDFGKQHDIILRYSKTYNYTYQQIKRPLDAKSKKPFNHDDCDDRGLYQTIALSNTTESGGFAKMKTWEWRGVNARWIYGKEQLEKWWKDNRIYKTKNGGYRKKDYLSEKEIRGILVSDIWVDVDVSPIQSGERLKYPTQKPLSLLERIIKASSKEGNVVLDPFCGCGTAVIASQKLNRNWIGIDITHLAINLIEKRLDDSFGIQAQVIGVPQSLDAAQRLADDDKFQFEIWAINLIPNLHANKKQVGDKGIDGKGNIAVGYDKYNKPKYETIIASVKGGGINPSMVRDLVGTVQSEDAVFGIFICIKKPTKKMFEAAAKGGVYTTPFGIKYPKVQIYTIRDYFDGKKPNIPNMVDDMKVQRQNKPKSGIQTTL